MELPLIGVVTPGVVCTPIVVCGDTNASEEVEGITIGMEMEGMVVIGVTASAPVVTDVTTVASPPESCGGCDSLTLSPLR